MPSRLQVSVGPGSGLTAEGYAAANTNRIAKRAGVSVGSVYQYFGNKDALITALAERHATEMFAAVGGLPSELSDAPLERVAELAIEALLAAHEVDPELHRVLMSQCPQVHELPSVKALEEGFVALLKRVLAERADEVREDLDPEVTAWLLDKVTEQAIHLAVRERPEWIADGRLKRQLTAMIVRYLARPTG